MVTKKDALGYFQMVLKKHKRAMKSDRFLRENEIFSKRLKDLETL
jgi:hypothetical protein